MAVRRHRATLSPPNRPEGGVARRLLSPRAASAANGGGGTTRPPLRPAERQERTSARRCVAVSRRGAPSEVAEKSWPGLLQQRDAPARASRGLQDADTVSMGLLCRCRQVPRTRCELRGWQAARKPVSFILRRCTVHRDARRTSISKRFRTECRVTWQVG